jgi:hypothetical protein
VKTRVYLDTSVFGAVCDPGPVERPRNPPRAWSSRLYMASGAMPTNGEYDARHIAVATVNRIHTVVSWNFRHMVNVERRRQINAINLRKNLALLDIVSPWEIVDEEL